MYKVRACRINQKIINSIDTKAPRARKTGLQIWIQGRSVTKTSQKKGSQCEKWLVRTETTEIKTSERTSFLDSLPFWSCSFQASTVWQPITCPASAIDTNWSLTWRKNQTSGMSPGFLLSLQRTICLDDAEDLVGFFHLRRALYIRTRRRKGWWRF